jgi:hypothetical protein
VSGASREAPLTSRVRYMLFDVLHDAVHVESCFDVAWYVVQFAFVAPEAAGTR